MRLVHGKEMLLDTAGKVLVDSFSYPSSLNFYSLAVSATPNHDTTRQNFKTINGQYVSFVDFDKEFNAWLKTERGTKLTRRLFQPAPLHLRADADRHWGLAAHRGNRTRGKG
jgi:hypothetical protein